ncbi:putative tellurite resistance protein B-like protein [Ereboglobus sp. PH5-10]|uniref:tellurite resistance TerB C-terminal domain-containing protein n=1 Tax=Ereboglobus sp. PH5-10 TaxID=2940629 RepID=UPI002404D73F|nr:tellurite resistance TerB C-terminal domain-containing protein [Ereboglobus sp. PH5-10]MDF9826585.1 putative tellurite resistance protein B-like protein [Ereboglobus sp. PH5-10]
MRYYYRITVIHKGLNRQRVLKGNSKTELEYRAQLLLADWEETWKKRCEVAAKRKAIADRRAAIEAGIEDAEERTTEAQQALANCRSILTSSLRHQPPVTFEQFKRADKFPEPEPVFKQRLSPPPPNAAAEEFSPKLSLLDKIIPPLRRKKEAAAQARFASAQTEYSAKVAAIKAENIRTHESYLRQHAVWISSKKAFEQQRAAHNAALDAKEIAYRHGDPRVVAEHCDLVLTRSEYPDFFPKEFSVDYRQDMRMLIVDYTLPDFASIPRLSEVRFQKTKKTFTEKNITETDAQRLYAELLVQSCLRSIHELCSADRAGVLDSVAFNGWVRGVSPATGRLESACLASLHIQKSAFLALNLAQVAPRICFDELGGVFSTKPHQLSSIRPIVTSEDFDAEAEAAQRQPPSYAEQLASLVDKSDASGVAFLKAADLRTLVGLAPETRASAQSSRELVELLNADGYCVEPDAAALGISYKARDEVAVFKVPGRIATHPSAAYLGSSALLQLMHLVASADGTIDPAEEKLIRDQLAPALAADPADSVRLNALSALLRHNPAQAGAGINKITRRLDTERREKVMRALVLLAAADGLITDGEKKAIARAAAALELPESVAEKIIPWTLADDFVETTIAAADAPSTGETIPAQPTSKISSHASYFALDADRIAAITRETSEVVKILADVLSEETNSPPPPAASTPTSNVTRQTPENNQSQSTNPMRFSFDGLPQQYHAMASTLCKRRTWTASDFANLARDNHLLPNGVIEAVNAWADEALGDFLLVENEDGSITINSHLLVSTPKE